MKDRWFQSTPETQTQTKKKTGNRHHQTFCSLKFVKTLVDGVEWGFFIWRTQKVVCTFRAETASVCGYRLYVRQVTRCGDHVSVSCRGDRVHKQWQFVLLYLEHTLFALSLALPLCMAILIAVTWTKKEKVKTDTYTCFVPFK